MIYMMFDFLEPIMSAGRAQFAGIAKNMMPNIRAVTVSNDGPGDRNVTGVFEATVRAFQAIGEIERANVNGTVIRFHTPQREETLLKKMCEQAQQTQVDTEGVKVLRQSTYETLAFSFSR